MKSLNKSQRADIVYRRLQEFMPEPPIPLVHTDAYTLLVAVLLSAQCTDERVNQVTPELWKLGQSPAEMADRTFDEILTIVRPCGLGPKKAQAILSLSQILVQQYGGAVPQTLEALESLPGVGHKTAQVVLAQAFGQPAFPVDTHIHRLAQRWGLTTGKNVSQTEKDLKRVFPKETWNKLHLQIIYYGRAQCSARTVCDGGENACDLCPIFNAGRQRPKKTKKA